MRRATLLSLALVLGCNGTITPEGMRPDAPDMPADAAPEMARDVSSPPTDSTPDGTQDIAPDTAPDAMPDASPDAAPDMPVTPPPLKAFPTAWGAGADVTGGRGGQVIHVTTLDWDAPGGLREAIATPGPRTIVFDVSGEIDATSMGAYEAIIDGSEFNDLTIAGQTAPEGGITIRTTEFMFRNVDNVILRYLRFRQDPSSNQDAMWMTSTSRMIIDHCSFSHGGDESASIASSRGMSGEVTIQRSLFKDSKTGTILGVDDVPGDFTYALNLVANISHRFPNPKGEGHYDIFNNVVYNWKNRLVRITGGGTYNIVDNAYKSAAAGLRKPGWFDADHPLSPRLHKVQTQPQDNPKIFAAGSILLPEHRTTPQADDRDMFQIFAGSHLTEGDPVPDGYFVAEALPYVGPRPPTRSAAEAYEDVLADVGANRYLDADGVAHAHLDDYDAATLEQVREDGYTGDFYGPRSAIPHPVVPERRRPDGFDTDRDGMPDAWERARGLDPTDGTDHALDADGDGYTNLEAYLNGVDR